MRSRQLSSVPAPEEPEGSDVEAVVAATREIGGLIARTLALVEPPVTMPQWRVIVLASEAGCKVSTIATDLQIHPSNATRLCHRLVRQGLLQRNRSEEDRRHVFIALTESGQQFHRAAMELRREAVASAMEAMATEDRRALASAMPVFAAALASSRDSGAWIGRL